MAALLQPGSAGESLQVQDPAKVNEDGPQSSNAPRATSTALMTTANLVTSGLGAGILSLPWTTAGASALGGATITGIVLLVNAWTVMILIEATEKYQVFDIGTLLARLPGSHARTAQAICNFLVWMAMFICLIGYLIIIADSMQPIASFGFSEFWGRAAWVVIGSSVALPLSFLDLKYLSFTSTLIILMNIYLFGIVLYFYLFADKSPAAQEAGHSCILGLGRGCTAMFSNLMMAVVIQSQVQPMYQCLEQRSVKRFRGIVYLAFFFLFILFVGFQTLAMVHFGPIVQSNVLKDFPATGAGKVAKIGMAAIMPGIMPLKIMSMVAPVRAAERGGPVAAKLVTLAIMAAAALMAFFVQDLGTMNALTGAVSVVGLVTVCPAAVGIYLLGRNRGVMLALMVFGCIMSMLGFVFTQNYVGDLTNNCWIEALN